MKIYNIYTGKLITEANLHEADLRGADLREANLHEADLYEADLYRANLREANLHEADLRGANLYEANLYRADFYKANLYGANLRGADLYGVNLHGANLRGADLNRAKNYYSFFSYNTSKLIVHCILHEKTWMIKVGCFWGTLEELEKEVKDAHNCSVYLVNIEILKKLK